MSFVVGLTGGIGSGKSTVADLFSEWGVSIVDTDIIARDLTATQGAAMPAIREAFGGGVLAADGSLDRGAMRRLAFADAAAKARLEGILHPLIRQESAERCARAGGPYVMLVVPLLVETGAYRDRVDRVLLVDCDETMQMARVMARSGLSADEVRAIMSTQATREQRRKAADDVIDNSGASEALNARVDELHRIYLEVSGKKLVADC